MQIAGQPEVRAEVTPFGAKLSAWLQARWSAGVRWPRVGAIVRRKVAVSGSQARGCTGTLGQVIADLDLLNRNTEQDFLRIGGKLAEFIEAVNLISSELAALANAEHGQRAAQALTCALDRSMEMNARYADRNGGLGCMREAAGRLKQTLSGFKGTVSTFHTLGVLTRIEAARLGNTGADFGNLADDVRLLAGSIEARVQNALDTAVLLIPRLESAMRNISALDEGQAKDLPSVISEVSASLSSLRDIQSRVHASSVRMGAQYDAISDAFKKLIVSVQFHDITRQQVEHVIEVLRRLCSESDRRGAAAVLALQASQLADASEKFATSVTSVAHNLDDIATHVLEMAGESRMLSGLGGDENNSYFLQMERGCSDILAGLSHCAKAEAATRAASDGLAETIGRMCGSLEEIRAIEIQMLRMAMNARIRATHIGAPADALGVLAGTMQELALESEQRSESLDVALGSMSEAVTRMSAQGGPVPTSGGDSHDGYLLEMRTAVDDLTSSNERSFIRIAQIIDRGARLSEDLSAARKSFSVGALFAEAVSRAQGMLKEIGEKNRSGLSREDTEGFERGLADFAGHYTMQAERDVHGDVTRLAAGAAPVAVRAEQPEVPPAEAEDLGENVEFF